jgi:membrane protease YdiL (CAAX protease family)
MTDPGSPARTPPIPPAPPHAGPPAGTARTLLGGTRLTHPVRRQVPRWGRLPDPAREGARLSTAPLSSTGPGSITDPRPLTDHVSTTPSRSRTRRSPVAPAGWVVVAGGLLFLLARPALGASPAAVPVLGAGYLVLLILALAVRANSGDPQNRAPLGWRLPLLLGLVGVAGASVVGGPVADRRVGAVAAGLALVAAVAEEALFRRVLYDRLLRFGVVAAVIGSAGVFALVHLPAYGVAAMPVDLGAALLLSWQRYASGRWTVPAVTHAVANLLAVT